jgi:autotransporter-associated beta strand protein
MIPIRRNAWCGVVAIFVCAVAWAARAQLPSVGHGRTVETLVTGVVAEADAVVVAGTLRKLGEGRLTVTASHFTGGTIEVDQGTLALDASSSLAVPVLPPHILTNNLLLWVDATTNVVMDSEVTYSSAALVRRARDRHGGTDPDVCRTLRGIAGARAGEP